VDVTPMKVCLVGPGRWGSKLADAFRERGAQIACHVRGQGTEPVKGMGDLVSWRDLLDLANAKHVDVVACAATPEMTMQVYEACRDLAIPALLTKPLMLEDIGERPPLVPMIVDYVRLWSPHYHTIKVASQKAKIDHVQVEFYGVGPFRTFSGLWDYGPHAAAFLFDLLGDRDVVLDTVTKTKRNGGEYTHVKGAFGVTTFEMMVGNGSEEDVAKRLTIECANDDEYVYEEVGQTVRCKLPRKVTIDDKPQALQLMVGSFLDDVKKNHANLHTLWLTTKITNLLKQIEAR
jgi:hypothetical protein